MSFKIKGWKRALLVEMTQLFVLFGQERRKHRNLHETKQRQFAYSLEASLVVPFAQPK